MAIVKGIGAYLYFIRSYPKQTFLVVASLVAAAIAELFGIGMLLPLVGQLTGDTGTADASGPVQSVFARLPFEPTLATLLTILVFAIALKNLIMFISLRYAGFVSAKITQDFRINLIDTLMKAQWTYFTSQPPGRLASALSEEAIRAGNGYLLGCKALACLAMIGAYFLASIAISWQVCAAALVIGLLLIFLMKAMVKKARDAGHEATIAIQTLLNEMIAALGAVKPMKAMNLEKYFSRTVDTELTRAFNAQKSHVTAAQLVQTVYEPVTVLLMAVGIYYITTGSNISIQSALVMAFLFYRLMGQFSLLQNHFQNMMQAESAVQSLLEATRSADRAQEEHHGKSAPDLTEGITFRNVSFSHENRETPLFDNFNTIIKANRLNVLFGPSGTGKTSLVDIILGLYRPSSGDILIDETPLSSIDVHAWREKVGYVPQDTHMFNKTIRENLCLGLEGIPDDVIWDSLKQASADSFVRDLPEGLDYLAGEKGSRLSGGQKQRLSIARALLRKPSLLIMDEATTGLDAQNEKLVMDTIANIKVRTTVLLITHNQALLDRADHVIQLR